ncbi:UNVERIFIED_CONTAM: hypothetical protein K2H54_051325 [Gekko kuhli]
MSTKGLPGSMIYPIPAISRLFDMNKAEEVKGENILMTAPLFCTLHRYETFCCAVEQNIILLVIQKSGDFAYMLHFLSGSVLEQRAFAIQDFTRHFIQTILHPGVQPSLRSVNYFFMLGRKKARIVTLKGKTSL